MLNLSQPVQNMNNPQLEFLTTVQNFIVAFKHKPWNKFKVTDYIDIKDGTPDIPDTISQKTSMEKALIARIRFTTKYAYCYGASQLIWNLTPCITNSRTAIVNDNSTVIFCDSSDDEAVRVHCYKACARRLRLKNWK